MLPPGTRIFFMIYSSTTFFPGLKLHYIYASPAQTLTAGGEIEYLPGCCRSFVSTSVSLLYVQVCAISIKIEVQRIRRKPVIIVLPCCGVYVYCASDLWIAAIVVRALTFPWAGAYACASSQCTGRGAAWLHVPRVPNCPEMLKQQQHVNQRRLSVVAHCLYMVNPRACRVTWYQLQLFSP